MSEVQKTSNLKIIVTLIILGVILLAVTNPKKQDYVTWATEQAAARSSDELEKLVSTLITPVIVDKTTSTRNCVLFSQFNTQYETIELKVIGLLNNYIVLSSNLDAELTALKEEDSNEVPKQNELTNLLPNGSGWIIEHDEIVTFPLRNEFLIVAASQDASTDISSDRLGQVFIYKYNKADENNPWLNIWSSPQIESWGIGNEIVLSLNVVKDLNNALVVTEFNQGGAKGARHILALTLNSDGDVRLQKDLTIGIGSVEQKDGSIWVDGEWSEGMHELTLENGNFVDKVTPRSNMIPENAVELYFLLGSRGVVPASSSTVTVKVGQTISFVPQDEKTAQAFDSGKIQIYSDEWNGPPLTICEADRIKTGNSFTFTKPGIFNFGLYSFDEEIASENPRPTFTITVEPK